MDDSHWTVDLGIRKNFRGDAAFASQGGPEKTPTTVERTEVFLNWAAEGKNGDI